MNYFILPNTDMNKIYKSGQCFRISTLDSNTYMVLSGDKACICKQEGVSVQVKCYDEDLSYWQHYFDMGYDYSSLEFRLYSDPYSLHIIKGAYGLRRLNQDPWECLVSFIISQRKNIKSIESCISKLCMKYGDRKDFCGNTYYTFPSPQMLKSVYERDGTYDVSLGYRDSYVYDASLNSTVLEKARCSSYYLALKELKSIRGVGDKVANCVLLYSLGFNQAFPVDVWIERYLNKNAEESSHIVSFHQSEKGIVQLYIYYYIRNVIK